jgi:hypothetical protein
VGEVGTEFRFWEGEKEKGRFEDLVVYEIESNLEGIGWGGGGVWIRIVTGVGLF